jgi:hypothetical protein
MYVLNGLVPEGRHVSSYCLYRICVLSIAISRHIDAQLNKFLENNSTIASENL